MYEAERLWDRAQTGDFDANARANPPRGAEPNGEYEETAEQLDATGPIPLASLQCTADLHPWPDVLRRNSWERLANIHQLLSP